MTVRFQAREVTAAMIEGVVNSLRDILGDPDAMVNLAITDGIEFGDGFALKDFARLASLELKPGDVVQDEAG